MDNSPEQENPENLQRIDSFKVNVRKPSFLYIAENLAPVYKSELSELRRDGAMAPLREFHNSPFASIMSQIMDLASVDTDQMPEKVSMDLDDKTIKAIREKLPERAEAADKMLRSEIMRELNDAYSQAKIEAKVRNAAKKVKKFFRK